MTAQTIKARADDIVSISLHDIEYTGGFSECKLHVCNFWDSLRALQLASGFVIAERLPLAVKENGACNAQHGYSAHGTAART